MSRLSAIKRALAVVIDRDMARAATVQGSLGSVAGAAIGGLTSLGDSPDGEGAPDMLTRAGAGALAGAAIFGPVGASLGVGQRMIAPFLQKYLAEHAAGRVAMRAGSGFALGMPAGKIGGGLIGAGYGYGGGDDDLSTEARLKRAAGAGALGFGLGGIAGGGIGALRGALRADLEAAVRRKIEPRVFDDVQ